MIEILLITVSGIYVVLSFLLTIGLIKKSHVRSDYEPPVSIVIPARNEEENIERCLTSLEALEYPREKLEIVVVDDHSDDNTASIVRSFSERNSTISLVSLSGQNPGERDESGKIAALAEGYRLSGGEIILQTDVDCIVPRRWVGSMVSRFEDGVGIAGGMTILDTFNRINTCFTRIQSLDWMYLLGVGAGASGIGLPLSCFGNNLAIRRTAYEEAGGYESIPFTFTEDFAIFQAVTRSGWNAAYSLEEDSLIQSLPPKTFRAFLNQRLRWASGGIKSAGAGLVFLAAAFLLHFLVIVSIIFGVSPLYWAVIICITIVFDFIFLYILAKKVNRVKFLFFFPLLELYYYVYTTVFGLLMPFISSLSWKGRKY
ncbi:hypothetical protein AMJ80_02835 [bacterium SM23_31]|nr:MAG: hypothetical protein AMJ80_02835 [bacterium SM23_31]